MVVMNVGSPTKSQPSVYIVDHTGEIPGSVFTKLGREQVG